jgi:hypothetical protein
MEASMTEEHAADRALLGKALEALKEYALKRHYWEDHYGGHCETCKMLEDLLSSPAAQEALREREANKSGTMREEPPVHPAP